jgi:hypothetical protein
MWLIIPHILISDSASFIFVFILIGIVVCVGIGMMRVTASGIDALLKSHERETYQLKRKWLLSYGIEVFAQITEHKVEVHEDSEGVCTSTYFLVLTWEDFQTGQLFSGEERTTQPNLAKWYPIGSRLPVRYDPDDATFYAVSLLNVCV